MSRGLRSSVVAAGVAVIGLAAGGAGSRAGQVTQSVASSPVRLVQMRHHFRQVATMHEALIRGALDATRAPARELAAMPPPAELPSAGLPFVEALRLAGRRALDADSLAGVASATADMLTECGQCHRALGVPIALVTPGSPDVGGIVGHMLEHQQAIDDLLQGLFVPSVSQWERGATRLSAAPLADEQLPDDAALTPDIRAAEARVHTIARAAAADSDARARISHYVALVTTCAGCHSLHSRVWGPDRQGAGPAR